MKILLVAINAKYIHSNPAVYSLRAYAGEDVSREIDIVEYTINNRTQDILADLYHRKPDMIAISCYIWNWNVVTEILPEIPKILPRTVIWLGGPEVSYNAPEVMEHYVMVSGIMVGEGEETFKQLTKYYAETGCNKTGGKKEQLEDIQGIVFRREDEICSTMPRALTDLTAIPFLYENPEMFENRIIYYESSRGCPYRCSYCLSSIDKRVRFRNLEVVKKELQFFLDHNVKQVKFVDRTFNCNHEHAYTIWKYLYEHDNGVTNFHFEIEADIINEKELELLSKMRPGLVQMEIGVQTYNDKTLGEIQRTTDMKKLERVISCIKAGKNIHVHLDLIAGLPFEDYESFQQSFNKVYEQKPQQFQLGFLKVLKGSRMFEMAQDYQLQYLSTPPYEVLSTKWISYEELLQLKEVEQMLEIYYNSNQFMRTMHILEQVFETPYMLYEELAKYYREKNYFVQTPSRNYRYDVLFKFAMTTDLKEKEDIVKEALLFDLYARENVKSSPEFLTLTDKKETEMRKHLLRDFFEKEEEQRKYFPDYEGFDSRQLAKMIHTQWFSYPVWEENFTIGATPFENKKALMFDYNNRNPLTYEATFICPQELDSIE